MTDAEAKLLLARAGGRVLSFRANATIGYVDLRGGPCPFFSQPNRCEVYDVRPYNCRRFACLKGFRGTAKEAEAVKVAIQKRAQPWADAHGWPRG